MLKISLPKRFLIIAASLFTVLPLLISCNNNVTSSSNPNASTVVGSVGEKFVAPKQSSSSSSSNVSGATVRLAQIKSNGSLEVVSNQDATTKSDGSFQVTTDQSGVRDLVAMAKKNGIEYKSVIDSQVQKGLTIAAEPMTRVSTAKTNIYAQTQALSQGTTNVVNFPDVEMLINIGAGNSVYGDSASQQIIAQGIIKWEEAHNLALQSSLVGASANQITNLVQDKHSVTAQLQRSLYSNGSDTTTSPSIYNSFYQQIFSAYLNAGVTLPAYIETRAIATKALINNLYNLKSTSRFDIEQNDIGVTSIALDFTNRSGFQNLGGSTALVDSSISAIQTFQSKLVAATSLDSIKADFEQMHNVNVNLLKSLYPQQASAIDSVDQAINASDGLRSQLETNTRNVTSPQDILKAYVTFFDSIKQLMNNKVKISNSQELQVVTAMMEINNIY
ncbi:MAG TPA: hypothetical protein VKA34_18575 [Balneolales bacterium]|nr:hypothetical protein [Balneolales bacterium]